MAVRVVCAGTFDHFHPGHSDFLRQAKCLGDELIVIVARDETVLKIKGIRPDHDEGERKTNVEKSGIPDRVMLGYLLSDIYTILKDLAPDVVALGYDQRVPEEEIAGRFPLCRVVRLSPFHPEKFKSSYYRKAR